MQQQSTQNMYVPTVSSTPNNNAGRTISHQQQQIGSSGAAGIYRSPPPPSAVQSNQAAVAAAAAAAQQQAPPGHQGGGGRSNSGTGNGGAARHVPMSMFPQTHMHQNVVLPYASYNPRQPPFQTQQYPFTQHNIYPYPNFYLQQPPPQGPHQRGVPSVGVASVNIGVGATLSGPSGPNNSISGPTGTSGTAQAQISLTPAVLAAAIGSVSPVTGGTTTGGASQVGVTVPPTLVGVVPSQQAPPQAQQQQMPTIKRLRPNALQIIHPDTKKNILEDLDFNLSKNSSPIVMSDQNIAGNSIDIDYQELHIIAPNGPVLHTQDCVAPTQHPQSHMKQQDHTDLHQNKTNQNDSTTVSQTPIVSAISNAPSVEIPHTIMQKTRSKKIPIVPPKDEPNRIQSPKDSKHQQEAQSTIIPIEQIDQPYELLYSESLTNKPEATQANPVSPPFRQPTNNYIPKTEYVSNNDFNNSNIHPTQNMLGETSESKKVSASKNNNSNRTNERQQSKQQQKSSTCSCPANNSSAPIMVTESVCSQNTKKDMHFNGNQPNTLTKEKIINVNIQQTATTSSNDTQINSSRDNRNDECSSNLNINVVNNSSNSNNNIENNISFNSHNKNVKNENPSSIDETETVTPLAADETDRGLAADSTAEQYSVSNKIQPQILNAGKDAKPVILSTQNDVSISNETPNTKSVQIEVSSKAFTTNNTTNVVDPVSSTVDVMANEENASSTRANVINESSKTVKNDTANNVKSNTSVAKKNPDIISSEQQQEHQPISFLLNYNEGQWSPQNPTGKKQYDRVQLMQLRDVKASQAQPEVTNTAILPHPNMMPSFVRNNANKRVQSMIGPIGGNGSRGSSQGGSGERGSDSGDRGNGGTGNYNKQPSMSGVHGRGMIHVNLSLHQDVKLNETDNAWRPRVLGKSTDNNANEKNNAQEKEDLIRRVRGILNKLTPEKFDALVEEIIKLKIDTPDKMEDVMVLVFEKAIDEPNFSVSYARLCHRLITEVKAQDERMESGTKTNLAHFRNALLDKTEREFTQNVTQRSAKQRKLQPIIDKIKTCSDPNERAELEAQLEEEERKIRRRSGGTVRFIGELFKISMLTGKIIYSCIDSLLDPNSEDMLECLCKLLTTVGSKFEQTVINPKQTGPNPKACYTLENVMQRMQSIASKTDKEGGKVSSRVRFMLQDVIDLRKDKWQSKRIEGPTTMGQIQKEAQKEQYLSYGASAGSASMGSGGGSTSITSGTINSSSANGQSSLSSGKRPGDDRNTGGRYSGSSSVYGGSHGSQRSDTGSLRRRTDQSTGGTSGGSSASNTHINNQNDDNTWHVQTGKGGRSLDTNKLEGLNQNWDINIKKMGGVQQFLWTNNARPAPPPTTTPNSFAALSSLLDSHKGSNERDRDHRSGPRNKSSYSKGSIERDRYCDRGLNTRSGSSNHTSRENSSSRSGGPHMTRGNNAGLLSGGSSSLQKSISHSKYASQPDNRSVKSSDISSSSVIGSIHVRNSGNDQQVSYVSGKQSSPTTVHVINAAPPKAVFTEATGTDLIVIKSAVSEMIENVTNSKIINSSTVSSINNIKEAQRCSFLYYILTDYLHLSNVSQLQRRYLGNIVVYLIKNNVLSVEHFRLSYIELCKIASDLIYDIPELWMYIFEFCGPLLLNKYITFNDMWNKQLKEEYSITPSLGKKFLRTFLIYCTREIGPSYTRAVWKKYDLKYKNFLPENEIKDFVEVNKFTYIENESVQPEIVLKEQNKDEYIDRIVDHIDNRLREDASADDIIDYVNGNVVDMDKYFIRSLTTILCKFAINYKDGCYKLDLDCFRKICIPVLQRYIDSNEERELESLYAMQLMVHHYEHPRGLLCELFVELYEADVIPHDSFIKWRDSKDQSVGKGVAVKGLNTFFNHLLSPDTSDENN